MAVVTETFYPFMGGSSRRYFEVFRRLAGRGYEVEVYTARLRREWPEREEVEGLTIWRTPWPLERFITPRGFRSTREVLLYTLWALKRLLAERYDLIEANHCPLLPCLPAWCSSGLRRSGLSITFHEVWQNHWKRYVPSPLYVPFGVALERLVARLPDLHIAVSEFTAQRLAQLLGVSRSRIAIIPNGVPSLWPNGGEGAKDPRRLIFVGRLNPHKRLELLLEALDLLVKQGRQLELEVVGDGPMRAFYEAYARRRGLMGRVRFLGPLPDGELMKRLAGAYIYVLPSEREGQSITTLEAMAAGTPQVVAAADGNGAVSLVRRAGSGLLVRPNSGALADGIELLLEEGQLWRAMRDKGLEYARRWPWERVAELHDRAYRRLLEGPSAQRPSLQRGYLMAAAPAKP